VAESRLRAVLHQSRMRTLAVVGLFCIGGPPSNSDMRVLAVVGLLLHPITPPTKGDTSVTSFLNESFYL
jgi:hypothetical protein